MSQDRFLSLLLLFFLVVACQAPESKTKLRKTKEQVPKEEFKKAPTENLQAKLVPDPDAQPIDLIYVLDRTVQIEYMFYVNPSNPSENSVTSDTKSAGEIKNFRAIISTERVKKPDCVYMGSAVFSDEDGDIVMDAAFNLTPDCHHIRLISEGETYYHKLSAQGVKFLSQFYAKMMKQQKEYDQQQQK